MLHARSGGRQRILVDAQVNFHDREVAVFLFQWKGDLNIAPHRAALWQELRNCVHRNCNPRPIRTSRASEITHDKSQLHARWKPWVGLSLPVFFARCKTVPQSQTLVQPSIQHSHVSEWTGEERRADSGTGICRSTGPQCRPQCCPVPDSTSGSA